MFSFWKKRAKKEKAAIAGASPDTSGFVADTGDSNPGKPADSHHGHSHDMAGGSGHSDSGGSHHSCSGHSCGGHSCGGGH
jgi:hypothetical protein